MQKTIILSLALVFAVSGVFAQNAAPANTATATQGKAPVSTAERARRATAKISTMAQLTDAQSGKITPMLEDYFNKMYKIKKDDNGKNSPETATRIQSTKQGLYNKLQTVLSADQLAKVKALYDKGQTK